MKTVLICHESAVLHKEGLARWMASFSDLSGIVLIRESKKRVNKRIKTEIKRVGYFRFFCDVLPFRFYSRIFLAAKDKKWSKQLLEDLKKKYPELPETVKTIVTISPSSKKTKAFLNELKPDIVIARCKTLLKEEIFTIPSVGVFVMHPGICPEYRNAHGCFWALAEDDLENVGMTLLKIDKGIDTGPVYGYFRYQYDEINETPSMIHYRVVFDNLDSIRDKIIELSSGNATTIDTTGRPSGIWGQPWLSKYLRWKYKARRRN